MSFVYIFYLLIIILAFLHTIGEVLYKLSSKLFLNSFKKTEKKKRLIWARIKYFTLIGVSISISFGVKIFYGIILGKNSLSLISGLFLGFITIFSVLLGRLIFKEDINKLQAIGMGLIISGFILLM